METADRGTEKGMEIQQVTLQKTAFLDLLMLADPQEDMIEKYLDSGDMFALYDDQGEVQSVCVVCRIGKGKCELKNLATRKEAQGKGYGSYFYSLALNKSFFEGKLDISLSAVNFFEAGMKMSNTTSTPYLTSTDSMVFDNRYFMIGVSYNFGNMKQIVKKAQRRIVNNDLLNTSGGTAGAASGGTGRVNP